MSASVIRAAVRSTRRACPRRPDAASPPPPLPPRRGRTHGLAAQPRGLARLGDFDALGRAAGGLHARDDGLDGVAFGVRGDLAVLAEALDDPVGEVREVLRPHHRDAVVLEERRIVPVRQEHVEEVVELLGRDAVPVAQAPDPVLEELVDEVLLRGGVLENDLVVQRQLVGADDELDAVALIGHEALNRRVKQPAEAQRALVLVAVEAHRPHELLELLEGVAGRVDRATLCFVEGLLGGSLEHLHQVAAVPVSAGGGSFDLGHRRR
jgi:hypothetical protein